jgi:WD40 repeat protein
MTTGQRNSKFYVVGGPVQPDRACYILRDSDASLYARLSERDYCHVLAPNHAGKTSLMAHVAKRLRASGVRVATIDLADISSRDVADDVGRWYYSLAYRIVRELRIRSDMQAWWQERSGLTNMQRLREFFLEVVLADTDEPVVIFVDRIEAALGQRPARDFFTAIRACYDARATEQDYQRLTFAMLGSSFVRQLAAGGPDSPFDISVKIELQDFDSSELRQLAAGLGCDQHSMRQIAERVWFWTHGQPYLSQKIFRALARRSDEQLSDEVVDKVVGTLFFAADGPQDEPHLTSISKQLLRDSPLRSARLSAYGRIRKGGKLVADQALDVHRDLLRSGIVLVDPAGRFYVRNRVYGQAFTAQWINHSLPLGWKNIATVAIVAIAIIGIPIWYTQYLPRPYMQSLTTPDQDFITAQNAYRRLHFLPGYGGRADQLFADYLVAQSRRSRRLVEVQRFSQRLAEIPGGQPLSEALLAEFWDRRAKSAMHRGDRDAALLYATRAMELPSLDRRKLVAELLGNDYGKLNGSIRTEVALSFIELDEISGLLTTLDKENMADVWQITDRGPRRIQRLELLAEEVFPLQRRLIFEGAATGKQLVVSIITDHSRPADILIELRAPSGRKVQLKLNQESASRNVGEFRFDSRRDRELRTLLDENMNGTWSANFTDNVQGSTGSLLEWQVRIDGQPAAVPAGTNPEPMVIPEAGVSRQAISVLSPGGRRALTWPADPAARGDILVWNVAGGEVLARIARPENFVHAQFARGQASVLIRTAQSVVLWDAEKAVLSATIPIDPSFDPVLSDDGQILVVDVLQSEGENALHIWDLEQSREVGRLVTGGLADVVATNGRFLAVGDGDWLVRLWSIPDGQLVGEYKHSARPTTIKFSGDWLLTEDAAHNFNLWAQDGNAYPVVSRSGSSAWSAAISGDSLLLGSLDRAFEVISLPSGESQGEGFRHGIPVPRNATESYRARTRLATEQGFAATYDGLEVVKIWRLAPQSLAENNGGRFSVGARATTLASSASIGPNGRQLAISTDAGDVRILPIDQQALLVPGAKQDPSFIGHMDPVTRTTFDASGELVASGSFDGSVRIWETSSGAPRKFFSGHPDGAVHDLIFSPDRQQLFSASRRSVIAIDAETGELLGQTQIQSEHPQLAISSDGQRIYIAGDRDGLTRWSWRGGISQSLIEPDSGIRKVALNRNESFFVTVDKWRQIQVWDVVTMVPREQTIRAPAAVDSIWLAREGSKVFVQAGVWLKSLAVTPNGLQHQATRLLETAPTAVYPADGGMDVFVLHQPNASSPVLTRMQLDQPWPEPIQKPLKQLVPELESTLSLTLNSWGDTEPVRQF